MWDINYHYSGSLALINLFIICFLIYLSHRSYFTYRNIHKSYTLLSFCTILYCTFAFAEADTYHYEVLYEMMVQEHQAIHVESFYYQLATIIPFSYYLWRLVIWGFAFFLYLRCAKHFFIDAQGLSLVFPILLLSQFAITRGALGISLFLFSWVMILDSFEKNRKFCIMIGVVGVICSYHLHHSMPLFILLALPAYFQLSKRHYFLLIILYPLVRVSFSFLVDTILNWGILDLGTQDFVENYLGKTGANINVKGYVLKSLTYIPLFLVYYTLIGYFTNVKNKITYKSRIFFQYSFILCYMALVFEGQEVSSFMASRSLHMMYFTLSIVLCEYLKYQRKYSVKIKWALLMFAFISVYTVSYHIYKWW